MSRYWSDHVSGLSPYVPGEQPKKEQLIKLNTNEHAFGPSPKVFEAIQANLNDQLRLYPQPGSDALVQAISACHGVGRDQVFVGNSSDEVLAHLFNALFRKADKPLWLPDITYSFYKTYCKFYDIEPHFVSLDEQLQINATDYHEAQLNGAGGIIFANPNAPTGHYLTLDKITRILALNPAIPVVVDEAYINFGAQSALNLLQEHENLVVVHTLSKGYALAGLRVGYALASAEIVAGLQRVKDSFNSYPLDRLAQAGAVAALNDSDYYDKTNAAIIENRDYLTQALSACDFEVLPSMANFVFARPRWSSAKAVFDTLREQGILVRFFDQPRINEFLRITVGNKAECEALITAIKAQKTK